MNKHAYLVMGHDNWSVLEKLLLLLDDERNDIYLHIDARVNGFSEKVYMSVKYSNIVLVNRISVYWADFSQVEATLELMKTAKQHGDYSYYHLLSGVDLPIKSNNEIYSFFESSGKNFLGIVPNEVYYSVRRVKFYHPFLHNKYYRSSKFLKGIDRFFEYIQKFCGVNRLKNNNWKIVDGWTWFSITKQLCEYVLNSDDKINKMFSNTIASDELFMQTVTYNSPFRDELFDMSDLKRGSMRFIDWQRGKPYTWGADENDYQTLMESPYMFARKFDERYMGIVEQIFSEIDRRNKNDK